MTQTISAKQRTEPATIRVKHRRPLSIAGLYVITLGFYSIYWWYVVNRELRDLGRSRGALGLGESPAVSTFAFASGACVLVPYIWTAVTTSRRVERAQRLAGLTESIRLPLSIGLFAAGGLAVLATAVPVGTIWLGALVVGSALEISALGYLQSALNRTWTACGQGPGIPARRSRRLRGPSADRELQRTTHLASMRLLPPGL